MGLFDSNRVIETQQVTTVTLDTLDLSSAGNKAKINISGQNTLCLSFSFSGDGAILKLYPRSIVNTPLIFYDSNGNLIDSITKSGVYYADVTGITSVIVRCTTAGSGVTTAATYFLANDAPISIASIKPIQLLKEIDQVTAAGTSFYTLFGVANLPKYFKYFFIVGYYELSGTAKICSLTISFSDNIRYLDGGTLTTRSFSTEIYRCADVSSFKTGFIENQQAASSPTNGNVTFSSTPVEGAILHLRIFGVR